MSRLTHLPHGSRKVQLLSGEVCQLLRTIFLPQVGELPKPHHTPGDIFIEIIWTGEEGRGGEEKVMWERTGGQ